MSAENFLDTNVIIYMLDETDVDKRQRAEALVNENLEQGNGCISFQVVQETINVLVHKLGFRTEDFQKDRKPPLGCPS